MSGPAAEDAQRVERDHLVGPGWPQSTTSRVTVLPGGFHQRPAGLPAP
jgi:hypothetical protein